MNYKQLQMKLQKLDNELPKGPFKCCRFYNDGSMTIGDNYYQPEEAIRVMNWLIRFYAPELLDESKD